MITAVVMVRGKGADDLGGWVRRACQAAAYDLLSQLRHYPEITQCIIVSPDAADFQAAATHTITSPPENIHVGKYLAQIVREFACERLLYFGGGSAPLLSNALLSDVIKRLLSAKRLIITDSRFASDWAGITPASILLDYAASLSRDNKLGWVLSTDGGLDCYAYPTAAATSLDIDAPNDLRTLHLHPQTKPYLHRYLSQLPLDNGRLEEALQRLATPASQVLLTGRVGPDVWQALNRTTQVWVRVLSEERGMGSNGRQERGEVRSFLADYIAAAGLDHFFTRLEEWVDVAFIDTRVLLAHHQLWPDENSRFASDLGLVDQIDDNWLRDFTARAAAAAIPIILGSHSLMAGNMLAFCEILQEPQFASKSGKKAKPA